MPVSRHFHLSVLLCFLLMPGIAVARDQKSVPTPYGLKYYRASAVTPRPAARVLQSAPDAANYRRQVEDAELANGPYSPVLGEMLSGEASYLEQRGNHEAAIDSLRRAVHVTRINDGLHSPMIVPLVRRLYSNYLVVGDREMADDAQQYLFFLARESWDELSPEGVAATVELADWRRKTWLVELFNRDVRRWYQSYQLIDDAMDELRLREDPQLELLEPLTYAQLRQLYLLGEGEFGLSEEVQMALGRRFTEDQNQQLSHEERQLQLLQKNAYSRGRKLLEALSQAQREAGNRRAQARAELYLADWHIWHNRSTRAAKHYRQCWQLLTDSELRYLREEWFDEPKELPVDEVFFAGPQLQDANTVYVPINLRFTVSARGKPGAIDTLSLGEEYEGLGYRLQRWLRAARFRPLLDEGEMVDSTLLEVEYLVAD